MAKYHEGFVSTIPAEALHDEAQDIPSSFPNLTDPPSLDGKVKDLVRKKTKRISRGNEEKRRCEKNDSLTVRNLDFKCSARHLSITYSTTLKPTNSESFMNGWSYKTRPRAQFD